MEEEKHLATDETNENMEKDKMIDNGNIIITAGISVSTFVAIFRTNLTFWPCI
jgi:hypothetical protein